MPMGIINYTYQCDKLVHVHVHKLFTTVLLRSLLPPCSLLTMILLAALLLRLATWAQAEVTCEECIDSTSKYITSVSMYINSYILTGTADVW